jgi:hypothetical protein
MRAYADNAARVQAGNMAEFINGARKMGEWGPEAGEGVARVCHEHTKVMENYFKEFGNRV